MVRNASDRDRPGARTRRNPAGLQAAPRLLKRKSVRVHGAVFVDYVEIFARQRIESALVELDGDAACAPAIEPALNFADRGARRRIVPGRLVGDFDAR